MLLAAELALFGRYDFFKQFGEVASITVALDNGEMLRALADDRLHRMAVLLAKVGHEAHHARHGSNTEGEVELNPDDADELWVGQEVKDSTKKVHGVAKYSNEDAVATTKLAIEKATKRAYPVSRVFCVYEHESGQRRCLSTLSNGIVPAFFNFGELPEAFRFRGTNVLAITEAPEPTEIIWEQLTTRSNTDAIKAYAVAGSMFAFACWASIKIVQAVMKVDSPNVAYFVAGTISFLKAVAWRVIEACVREEGHDNRSMVEKAIMEKTFLFNVRLAKAICAPN